MQPFASSIIRSNTAGSSPTFATKRSPFSNRPMITPRNGTVGGGGTADDNHKQSLRSYLDITGNGGFAREQLTVVAVVVHCERLYRGFALRRRLDRLDCQRVHL